MSAPDVLRRLFWRIWHRGRPVPPPPAGPTYYYQIVTVKDVAEDEAASPITVTDEGVQLTFPPISAARRLFVFRNGAFVHFTEIRGDEEDA